MSISTVIIIIGILILISQGTSILPRFFLADRFMDVVMRSSFILFDGSTGRYKTLGMIALADEIMARGKHKQIVGNLPIFSPHARSGACDYGIDDLSTNQVSKAQIDFFKLANFGHDYYRDTIILIDEASLLNELLKESEVNQFFKDARKRNQIVIAAGVGNASNIRKFCKMYVQLSPNGNLQRFGLPVLKYIAHEIQDRSGIGSQDGFYLLLPSRFFGSYATKFVPDFNIIPIDQFQDKQALYNWRSLRVPDLLKPLHYVDSYMLAKRLPIDRLTDGQLKVLDSYDKEYKSIASEIKKPPPLSIKKNYFSLYTYLSPDFDPFAIVKLVMMLYVGFSMSIYLLLGNINDFRMIQDFPDVEIDMLLLQNPLTFKTRCAFNCQILAPGCYLYNYQPFGVSLKTCP